MRDGNAIYIHIIVSGVSVPNDNHQFHGAVGLLINVLDTDIRMTVKLGTNAAYTKRHCELEGFRIALQLVQELSKMGHVSAPLRTRWPGFYRFYAEIEMLDVAYYRHANEVELDETRYAIDDIRYILQEMRHSLILRLLQVEPVHPGLRMITDLAHGVARPMESREFPMRAYCVQCNVMGTFLYGLTYHIKSVHQSRDLIDEAMRVSVIEGARTGRYDCVGCEMTFRRLQRFVRHVVQFHRDLIPDDMDVNRFLPRSRYE